MSYEVTKIVSGGWPQYTLRTDDLEKALKLMRLQSNEIRQQALREVWPRTQLMFKTYLNALEGIESTLQREGVLIYGMSTDGGLTRVQIRLSDREANEADFDWWLRQIEHKPFVGRGTDLFFRAQARLFFRSKGLLLPKTLPEVKNYSTSSRAYISLADVRRFIFAEPQSVIHNLYVNDDMSMMRVFYSGGRGIYSGYTDTHMHVSIV